MNRCLNCMKVSNSKGSYCEKCGFNKTTYKSSDYALSLGTILNDRYVIGIELGSGGFGITYKAFDKRLEVTMAIKEFLPNSFAKRDTNSSTVIPSEHGKQEQFSYYMDKFLEEARALAKFSNEKGIVSIQDVFEENGTIYIVMYYVDGIDLNTYLSTHGNRLSLVETLDYMFVIMESLIKIHGSNLIHRDISPDNIYITSDGQAKLLDFGAARYTIGTAEETISVILKQGYAPIEQYSERSVQGPWTDVYGVAATMYKMLTGVKPVSAVERVSGMNLPSVKELGVSIPDYIDKAIMKALEVDMKNRFQSIQAFMYALKNDQAETVLMSNRSMPTKKPRKVPYAVFILLLVVVIGSLSVKFLFFNAEEESNNVTQQNNLNATKETDLNDEDLNIDATDIVIENTQENENISTESSSEEVVVEVSEENNEPVPEVTNYPDFQINPQTIHASSSFVEVYSGGTIYNYPENVLDGDVKTAWVEDIKGVGKGEWIAFSSDQIGYIRSISIINGYTKSSNLFYWNDRLKQFRLEFSDGSTQDFTLADNQFDFQTIYFDEPILSDTVKLIILEVYPGDKYADCCITEIRIN